MSGDKIALCELCGEPMPIGEEVFKYHGYSGPCPKPPLPKPEPITENEYQRGLNDGLEQAARICEKQVNEPECPERAQYCAEAIRARIKK